MNEATRARQRVLVVDEDAERGRVVRRMLEGLGYRADIATDVGAAVESFACGTYVASLIDDRMPELDRLARCALRPARDDTRLPLIAMTAHSTSVDRRRLHAAGVDDSLSKPVLREDLARTLETWTSDAREPRRLETR